MTPTADEVRAAIAIRTSLRRTAIDEYEKAIAAVFEARKHLQLCTKAEWQAADRLLGQLETEQHRIKLRMSKETSK